MELSPAFTTEAFGSEVFSVRFSPDSSFLAASNAHGQVSVYNVSTSQEAYRLNRNGGHPMKQVVWRPEEESGPLRTRCMLVGACTDGIVRQWHVTSGKCLQEFGDPEQTGQLFCVDYSPDASRIVAGGMQELWVFDEETKKQSAHLKGGDSLTTAGHSSRVFAVRCNPVLGEPCSIISGGWDSSVQFWDVRVGHAVRAVYGPHVCGDALDISADGRTFLTGSWREKDALELWDFRSEKRLEAIPWRTAGLAEPACQLYSARFSRAGSDGSQLIAAGGSFSGPGGGEAKVLELQAGGTGSWSGRHCAGTLVHFTCLSADFAGKAALVALAGMDGRVHVMRLGAPGKRDEDTTAGAAETA